MRRAIWITGTFVILASILVLFVLDSCSAASKKFGTQAPAVTPAASAAPVGRGTQPPVAETAPTAGVKPGDDAVDFAGTYVATLTPGAFALRAVTLTLLSNLGAEMMTEYVDGRAAVVEAGSWGPSGTSGRVRLETPPVRLSPVPNLRISSLSCEKAGYTRLTIRRRALGPPASAW